MLLDHRRRRERDQQPDDLAGLGDRHHHQADGLRGGHQVTGHQLGQLPAELVHTELRTGQDCGPERGRVHELRKLTTLGTCAVDPDQRCQLTTPRQISWHGDPGPDPRTDLRIQVDPLPVIGHD